MRHLFTDLQCERSKSRWREPGVIAVTHELLFRCTRRVNVAAAHWSSSLSDLKTLNDEKARGPRCSTGSVVTSDGSYGVRGRTVRSQSGAPSPAAQRVRAAARGRWGSHRHLRHHPCGRPAPSSSSEGRRGPGQPPCLPPAPARVLLPARVWVSCLLLRAQRGPPSPAVTLARGELGGWQRFVLFWFLTFFNHG